MYTPEFSFVSFWDEGSLDETRHATSLPYVSTDDIAFQVISVAPITAVVMTDMEGNTIEETNREILNYNDAHFIKPQFTSRPDCFRLILKSGWDIVSGFSNVFVLVDDDEQTSVVAYCSDGDSFGFSYGIGAFMNKVRLPLQLMDVKFSQTRDVYGTLSGRQKILSASVRNEYDIDTDYMTEEMHRNLIIALMHDEVYISGQLLTQTGDYSVDWGNYLMSGDTKTAKGKCTVSANVVSRSSNCSQEPKMQLVNDDFDLTNDDFDLIN